MPDPHEMMHQYSRPGALSPGDAAAYGSQGEDMLSRFDRYLYSILRSRLPQPALSQEHQDAVNRAVWNALGMVPGVLTPEEQRRYLPQSGGSIRMVPGVLSAPEPVVPAGMLGGARG